MKQHLYILLLGVLLSSSFSSLSQETEKWTNKNRGTYIFNYNYKGILTDTLTTSVGIWFYELSAKGLKRLTGKVAVNGIEYNVYEKSEYIYADGQRDSIDNTVINLQKGYNRFSASAGKEYYPINTANYYFYTNSIYRLNFYFIRKDELKKE